MKKNKLSSINKKICFLVSTIIIISLLSISLINYIIAKGELNRSNQIILENAIESTLFEINKNYEFTQGDTGFITEEEAKNLSLNSVNALRESSIDGTSAATEEVDGVSNATANSVHKYHTLNLGESGYLFIIDSNGEIVSHPFLEGNIFELQSSNGKFIVQEMIEVAKAGGGTLNYALDEERSKNNSNKTVYTQYFPHWDWIATAVIYDSELQRGSNIILANNAIGLIAILAISLLFTIVLTRKITKPIKEISHTLQEVSGGNLTVSKVNIKAKDETKLLGDSVNHLIDRFQSIVRLMMTSSNSLNQYSMNLKQSADTVSEVTAEVSKAISHMSISSDNQYKETSNSVDRVNQLGEDIKETAQASKEIEIVAKKTIELKEVGVSSVNELKEASHENNLNSNAIEDVVNEINQHSVEVGGIVDIIAGVANQINLLALNANIEAARAGEHGRGFAVVADEVRKLSNETAIATESIGQKINEMQLKSKSAVDYVIRNKKGVDKINQTVVQTENIFDKMATELEALIESINVSVNYNYEINDKKDDILHMLDQVSVIAEENSASIEEISASAQEQSATVMGISENISHLNEMVTALDDIINKFTIE